MVIGVWPAHARQTLPPIGLMQAGDNDMAGFAARGVDEFLMAQIKGDMGISLLAGVEEQQITGAAFHRFYFGQAAGHLLSRAGQGNAVTAVDMPDEAAAIEAFFRRSFAVDIGRTL